MNSSNFMQKAIRNIDNAYSIRKLFENHRETQRCINEKDEHGDTLLHFASRIHNMDVMAVLLELGADPEAVNEHGRRPIHEVIDSLACVQFLVQKYHVDVNAMKRGDWTPVMIAALKGNLDIVKFLTESGALLNRHTKDGRTALYLAVQEGHIELSKYLADQYPAAIMQATNSGRLPTQAAAALHNDHDAAIEITHYLLSHASIPLPKLLGHRDNSGRNMLLDSAVSQNLPLLKFLLDQGADANDADSLGRNMIHHAAMMGHLNVLNMLSTLKGLSWNTPDAWDFWTPLMHAARQGHFDIVKYLIETVQVDPNKKDKQGRTAQALASLWHHDAIAAYLASLQ
ncbi:hypothetical protein PS15p_208355 [Mucor circinelloides]